MSEYYAILKRQRLTGIHVGTATHGEFITHFFLTLFGKTKKSMKTKYDKLEEYPELLSAIIVTVLLISNFEVINKCRQYFTLQTN